MPSGLKTVAGMYSWMVSNMSSVGNRTADKRFSSRWLKASMLPLSSFIAGCSLELSPVVSLRIRVLSGASHFSQHAIQVHAWVWLWRSVVVQSQMHCAEWSALPQYAIHVVWDSQITIQSQYPFMICTLHLIIWFWGLPCKIGNFGVWTSTPWIWIAWLLFMRGIWLLLYGMCSVDCVRIVSDGLVNVSKRKTEVITNKSRLVKRRWVVHCCFFPSVSCDGLCVLQISVGDTVNVQSEDSHLPVFIIQVQYMYEDEDGNKEFHGCWFR